MIAEIQRSRNIIIYDPIAGSRPQGPRGKGLSNSGRRGVEEKSLRGESFQGGGVPQTPWKVRRSIGLYRRQRQGGPPPGFGHFTWGGRGGYLCKTLNPPPCLRCRFLWFMGLKPLKPKPRATRKDDDCYDTLYDKFQDLPGYVAYNPIPFLGSPFAPFFGWFKVPLRTVTNPLTRVLLFVWLLGYEGFEDALGIRV